MVFPLSYISYISVNMHKYALASEHVLSAFPLQILKTGIPCFIIVPAEWEIWLPCGCNAFLACTMWASPCPILKESQDTSERDGRLVCVRNKGLGSSMQTLFIWHIKGLSDGDKWTLVIICDFIKTTQRALDKWNKEAKTTISNIFTEVM